MSCYLSWCHVGLPTNLASYVFLLSDTLCAVPIQLVISQVTSQLSIGDYILVLGSRTLTVWSYFHLTKLYTLTSC